MTLSRVDRFLLWVASGFPTWRSLWRIVRLWVTLAILIDLGHDVVYGIWWHQLVMVTAVVFILPEAAHIECRGEKS